MRTLIASTMLTICSLSQGCGGEPAETTGDAGAPDADAEVDSRVKVPASFDVEAHRGGAALKPESTLPAFENALDLGVDTLEMDLHFTKDDAVVIWHDPYLGKKNCTIDPSASAPLPPDPDTLPNNDPSLAIRSLDLADLKKYRCDRNPDVDGFPSWSDAPGDLAGDNYQVPTLGEVLDFVQLYSEAPEKTADQRAAAQKVRFNIESKRDAANPDAIGDGFDGTAPGPFEIAFVNEVEKRNMAKRTIVQSFEHASLWAVRTLNTDVGLSALTKLETIDFADYASKGITHWSPPADAALPDTIDKAHAAGLLVLPWTVNKESDMRHLIEDGADGLITDFPDVLLGIIVRDP